MEFESAIIRDNSIDMVVSSNDVIVFGGKPSPSNNIKYIIRDISDISCTSQGIIVVRRYEQSESIRVNIRSSETFNKLYHDVKSSNANISWSGLEPYDENHTY